MHAIWMYTYIIIYILFDIQIFLQYDARSMSYITRLSLLVIAVFVYTVLVSAPALAQTPTSTQSASVSPTPVMEKVDYELPYPGMLPDNPLYNIKALRDKIIEFLISSPFKKAEFYLLSSDKRFNSGYYLIKKDKDDLGVLYISKSNNYMNMAIEQGHKAQEPGESILKTMKKSIAKHTELINEVVKQVDQENKTKLKYEIDRLNKMNLLIK